MCLGVPMKVEAVDGWTAQCSAEGSRKVVNLMLIGNEDVRPGDFVLVHRDHALRTLSSTEAKDTWALLKEALGD